MRKQTISVDTAFSDARQWYHNTYMLTDTNSKTLQSIGTVKNDWRKVLTPYWDKGKAFKSKGLDFIELPALKKGDFAIAEQPVATGKFDFTKSNSITSLLIIKQNGIYGIYTMTILADSAYLKGNYASLNINTYRNRAKDFNGMVLYHKLDGTYVNGWRYVNGKVTTALYERKTNGTNQSIQSVNQQKTNTLSCQAVRVTTYWQDCAYYNDDLTYSHPFDCHYYTTETTVTACAENGSSGGGGGQNPDNVNDATKNIMVTDPNPAQPVDPGGGIIPPGSNPTNPCVVAHDPPPDVTNNVKNPCLKNMVNSTISAGVKNEINSLILGVFGANTKVNLNFIDVTTLTQGIEGYTPTSYYDANGNLNEEIQLNANSLPNSSQEYIASIIMHEALHAYLDSKGVADNLQHDEIINYVAAMAGSLQKMFPTLTDVQAKSLSLTGLWMSDSYKHTIATDLQLSGNYDAIRLSYSLGVTGKKCQ